MKKILVKMSLIILPLTLLWVFKEAIFSALIPFIIALFLFYMINPLVKLLVKNKLPIKPAAIICIMILIISSVILVFIITPGIINGVQSVLQRLPSITEKLNKLTELLLSGPAIFGLPEDVRNSIYNEIVRFGSETAEIYARSGLSFTNIVGGAANILGSFLVSLIILYYFFTHSEKIKDVFLFIFPSRYRKNICSAGHDIDLIMKGFIQGQLLTAVIVGTLEYIGLLIVGIDNLLLLSFIGGAANIIPYFGPFIGAVPAMLITLFENPAKTIYVALVFIVVQQLDNAFISPKIIESRIGLHPLVSIFSIMMGGSLFGLAGMFFAAPAVAIISVVFKRLIKTIIQEKEADGNLG